MRDCIKPLFGFSLKITIHQMIMMIYPPVMTKSRMIMIIPHPYFRRAFVISFIFTVIAFNNKISIKKGGNCDKTGFATKQHKVGLQISVGGPWFLSPQPCDWGWGRMKRCGLLYSHCCTLNFWSPTTLSLSYIHLTACATNKIQPAMSNDFTLNCSRWHCQIRFWSK